MEPNDFQIRHKNFCNKVLQDHRNFGKLLNKWCLFTLASSRAKPVSSQLSSFLSSL